MNPDGICYLQSASILMNQGIHAAREVCGQAAWPFYDILIAGMARFFHFSIIFSANSLNGFFSLLSVLFFVTIIRQLTPDKKIHWLGALTILIAHSFNVLRPDVIRDHGYWAFYLLSISLLLKFFSEKTLTRRLLLSGLWSISLIFATLFRVEGALFLLFLPLSVFLNTQKNILQRTYYFLQLSYFMVCLVFILMIWWMIHPDVSLGRLSEVRDQLLHGPIFIWSHFQITATALGRYVLSIYAVHDAPFILFDMLVAWYVVNVIGNLTIVFSAFILFAWIKKITHWKMDQRLVIWSYVVINVAITFLFLVENMFLAKRYLIALSLTLMIWVPFALATLIKQWEKKRWLLFLLIFSLFFVSIGGIVQFGPNKKYIRQAGDWVQNHATAQEKIYSNNEQLLYYSGHFVFAQESLENLFKNHHWQKYDWLALQVTPENMHLIKRILPFQPIQIFYDHRRKKNRVWIYQLKHQ